MAILTAERTEKFTCKACGAIFTKAAVAENVEIQRGKCAICGAPLTAVKQFPIIVKRM
jgi:transcription elongation factor Elf1